MELTVGYFKKVLAQLEDDVILADLQRGTSKFSAFNFEKRLLVLKDISEKKNWDGRTYLTINGMGSDFTGKGEQEGLHFTGVYFDEDTFKNES